VASMFLAAVCSLRIKDIPHTNSSDRRIIGGVQVPDSQYPWAAFFSRLNGHALVCGAELIAPRWVSTACHCVLNGGNTGYQPAGSRGSTQVKVDCGSNHDIHSPNCKTLDVKRIVPHPCYIPSCCDDHDDICLMELYDDAPIPLKDLPLLDGITGHAILKHDVSNVDLLGWGGTNKGMPHNLMKVEINVGFTPTCKGQEPKAVRENLINFDNVICTGGHAGKDSCNGDSGGGAVGTNKDGTPVLVGILVKGSELPINGPACGAEGRFAVYTRISKYWDFILTTFRGEEYKCANCFTGSVRTSCTSDPVNRASVPPPPPDALVSKNPSSSRGLFLSPLATWTSSRALYRKPSARPWPRASAFRTLSSMSRWFRPWMLELRSLSPLKCILVPLQRRLL